MSLLNSDYAWTVVGFLGQGLFFARFFVQWLASEKEKKSVVPVAFWYFSVIGGGITLIYVIHIGKWPLIIGQAGGMLIYCRNLLLIHRKPRPITDVDD